MKHIIKSFDQVIGMFQSDGETNQVGRKTTLKLLLR